MTDDDESFVLDELITQSTKVNMCLRKHILGQKWSFSLKHAN